MVGPRVVHGNGAPRNAIMCKKDCMRANDKARTEAWGMEIHYMSGHEDVIEK